MIYSSLFSLTELKKLSKNQQVCKYLIKGEYYLELYNWAWLNEDTFFSR